MQRKFQIGLCAALCLLLLFAGCKNDTPSAPSTPTVPTKTYKIPKFDRDSAYAYVAKQVDFGPRVIGTEAHQATKQYLVEQLRSFGAQVTEQDFTAKVYTGEEFPSTNIIGQYNPAASKRILLAAHWDSRHISEYDPDEADRDKPVLGADDGASGVGVLLEIARQLQQNPIEEMGIDIVFFDAEDYGQPDGDESTIDTWALGAQYFSRNLPYNGNNKPKYGILLDMVGAKDAVFGYEGISMQVAPQLMQKIWKMAASMGYGNYFQARNTGTATDDHYFVNTIARIPMIDIINMPGQTNNDVSFGDHWHTQDDTMEVIDARVLRAVGQVVLAVIYKEAGGSF